MTIKNYVRIAINQFPRLEQILAGREWPQHSHAEHTGLTADDHLHYMTNAAGPTRHHTGDLYLEADLRGTLDLRFDDYYRFSHTDGGGDWASDGIDLSANAAEWQAAYDLFGEERSILGMITGLASLVTGVTSVNGADGDLTIQGSTYISVATSDPTMTVSLLSHAVTHQNSGSDEIDVTNLSGRLADPQFASWFHSATYPISTTAPSTGQSLVWDGSYWAPTTVSTSITGLNEDQILFGSATGTIEQSASLTWDGTELYVNGNVDLNSHYLDNVTYIDLIDGTPSNAQRRIWWDGTRYCFRGGLTSTIAMPLGQSLYGSLSRNVSGAILDPGTAVYINGSVASNPTITPTNYAFGVAAYTAGLVAEEIAIGGYGHTISKGLLFGLDTSAWSAAGDLVYLGSSGSMATTPPDAPNALHILGTIIDVDATDGSMCVDIIRVPYLSYLSDVNARDNTHTAGDVLAWDAVNSRWDLATSVASIVSGSTSYVGDVEFYQGSGILIDSAEDGYRLSSLRDEIAFVAASYTLSSGTLISGTITDTQTVNLTGLVLQEVVTTPGLSVTLTLASVNATFERIQAHIWYNAPSSLHIMTMQLYNNNTTTWDTIANIGYIHGYQTIDVAIDPVESSVYINGSYQVLARFYHSSSGNTAHQFTIDYVGLVESFAGVGGGGTLNDAYNYGGSGAGREITANSGAVTITTPSGTDALAFGVYALDSSATTAMTYFINNSQGLTMYLGGSAGVSPTYNQEGHVIEAYGATTYKGTFGVYGQSFLNFWNDAGETNASMVTLRAEDDTPTNYSYLELSSSGGALLRAVNAGIELQSTLSLTINPANDNVYCSGSYFQGASAYVLAATPTTSTPSAGVVTVNFATGDQIHYVTSGSTITEVAVTNPVGCGFFSIVVEATANISITNFTSGTSTPFTWIGNYDLDAGAYAIPSGEKLKIYMEFLGTTRGWLCQVVGEV